MWHTLLMVTGSIYATANGWQAVSGNSELAGGRRERARIERRRQVGAPLVHCKAIFWSSSLRQFNELQASIKTMKQMP